MRTDSSRLAASASAGGAGALGWPGELAILRLVGPSNLQRRFVHDKCVGAAGWDGCVSRAREPWIRSHSQALRWRRLSMLPGRAVDPVRSAFRQLPMKWPVTVRAWQALGQRCKGRSVLRPSWNYYPSDEASQVPHRFPTGMAAKSRPAARPGEIGPLAGQARRAFEGVRLLGPSFKPAGYAHMVMLPALRVANGGVRRDPFLVPFWGQPGAA